MNVLHISSYCSGGAGIAARRIHESALAVGVDSDFLFLKSNVPCSVARGYQFQRKAPAAYERFLRKLRLNRESEKARDLMLRKFGGSYEIFTFPTTGYRINQSQLVQDADVIHLHWISSFIDYPSFFSDINKPIVWTFHDMNPLMGGFHYMGDKLRNGNLGEVDDKLLTIKRQALSRIERLIIATPSKWLFDCVEASDFLKHYRRVHIPYGLDFTVFKPIDKIVARKVFNLPLNKKILLFVSEKLSNYRKGFDLLTEAIRNLGNDEYVLVAVGSRELEAFHGIRNVLQIGSITDERLLSILYSAADLFVLPSREDNFPNVMLESLACGTPVMSFKTGGMLDAIADSVDGILVSSLSSEGLRTAIRAFLDSKFAFDQHLIGERANKRYNLSIQGNSYLDLYKELFS